MRPFPKNVSKNISTYTNTASTKQDHPLSASYVGTSMGTRFFSDASILDGLFDLSSEQSLRAMFRDMVANDPTIRSGIELRCALFDIDFSISGDVTTQESHTIKEMLVNAGIFDKIKTLVWNYFVYGEALMYAYTDDRTNTLYISNILNLDNCNKKTPMFGNKTCIEYVHGVIGRKKEIHETLRQYTQKIKDQNKALFNDYNKLKSLYKINSFADVKKLCENSTLEENDLFLIFKYSIETEFGKSSLTDYIAAEFYCTGKIDFTSSEFPLLINDNPVLLSPENLIYLNRSFVLEGGSSLTTINGKYQGLKGNAFVGSGSMLRPLVGLWCIESRYFRNTMNLADRRMNPPIWIQVGSKDEPMSSKEVREVGENWKNTNLDPSNGSTFISNHLVNHIQAVDTTPGAWMWDSTFSSYDGKKLQALGINESWFSGDASYNTYESVATAFGCQIARDRKYITKKVFIEVLLPLISKKLNLFKYELPKINVRITPKTLTKQDNKENIDNNQDTNIDTKTGITQKENIEEISPNSLKINIIPDDSVLTTDNSGSIDTHRIKITDLTQPNLSIRLTDPLIKIRQEDLNNKKTNIKISLKNLDKILSNEEKTIIINKLNEIHNRPKITEDEILEEEEESDEININIKELKDYEANKADKNNLSNRNNRNNQNIKIRNIEASNRILLSEALPKTLIVPDIEWEVSSAPENLDRIKSKIDMIKTSWNLSPSFIAHLLGVDEHELEKYGCTEKDHLEDDAV